MTKELQPEKVNWRDSQMCTILGGGGGQNPTPLHFGLSKDMQMFYAVNIGHCESCCSDS